ncbi:hypothetical protein JANAI62_00670 [Jannaschia pagri]|uniref:Uncharacterized protein n=1 Tax=Jannaschia pagri TaxID=2829797 RepID=A0ABQ4NG94_9RHOB|nr:MULTISPECIES: hypothetical protein [unclassified Jannaschia]GIT90451.1 hypothetical protein JANAI61_09090 [Jannaschia sp. AI_61]GIT93444.1 hypothetical protein JANAI62_00670 [Jannaschia sp. AI_62]
MFGKPKANRFNPDLQTFPEIMVDGLAADLRLEKRGEADARAAVPPVTAATLSAAELEAADAVRALRRRALSQYEMEQQAYAARIAEAGSARERVELMVGEARNSIRNLTLDEENRLENARTRVGGLERKLRDFQDRQGLAGPPKARQNGFLAFGLILVVGLCEVVLNGYFFAEQNALGYVGGIAIASVIAVVNVAFSYGLGGQVRYVNLRSPTWKVWGLFCLVVFLALAATLNLAVAHFRDALETLAWDAALIASVERLVAGPVSLRSFASWLVVGFGLLVSLTAFWKGLTQGDPTPGYNAIYDAWEDAIDDYAEAYGDAQDALEDAFAEARDKLEQEAQARRTDLKAAVDAVHQRGTLTRTLETFLETCDEAANRLIRLYRDANLRVRDDDGPAYFNTPFAFPPYAPPAPPDGDREQAQAEIARIDTVVRDGVAALLAAREHALDAYPTVREIKAGDMAPRPRVVAEAA